MSITVTDGVPRCPKCSRYNNDWADGLPDGAVSVDWTCECGAECTADIDYTVTFTTTAEVPSSAAGGGEPE